MALQLPGRIMFSDGCREQERRTGLYDSRNARNCLDCVPITRTLLSDLSPVFEFARFSAWTAKRAQKQLDSADIAREAI